MLEVMMGGMDAIGLVICYGAMVCMYLLMGVIVLWGIYLILKVLFWQRRCYPSDCKSKELPPKWPDRI